VIRNDAGEVTATITNVSISDDVYTFTSTGGQWATNIFSDTTSVGKYKVFYGDVFLDDYGVPLPQLKFDVRYAANTGSETYVTPLDGSWNVDGTNYTGITQITTPTGTTKSGTVITLARFGWLSCCRYGYRRCNHGARRHGE